MKNCFKCVVLLLAVTGVTHVAAQGVNDPTGPLPQSQAQQSLPSNTTPPTVNRQRNMFSPGAATPRAQRIRRSGRTRF